MHASDGKTGPAGGCSRRRILAHRRRL